MSMKCRKPAVFLDRDGVLTEEKSYITSVKEMHIFSYAAECVWQIHQKGYYAIVVTNQSGIARKLFSEQQLLEMNEYLMNRTGVDAVYYCPHHPEDRCCCRKPQTGMFETANKKFYIDMKRSFMVGDRASDVLAGQNAGVRTVLVESGYGMKKLEFHVTPDYIFKDLRDTISIL